MRNMFRKLNTSTEHDLEFLILLKGNSLQNVTFFCKNPQKVMEEQYFFTKKSEICIFYAIQFDRDGLTY